MRHSSENLLTSTPRMSRQGPSTTNASLWQHLLWMLLGGALFSCGGQVGSMLEDDIVLVLYNPVEGAVLSGTAEVRAGIQGVSQLSNLQSVTIEVDGEMVEVVSPGELEGLRSELLVQTTLDTEALEDGVHALRVVVRPSAGLPIDRTVGFQVDNTIPNLEITSPRADTIFFEDGAIAFRAETSDEYLESIALYVNDELVLERDNPSSAVEFSLDPEMLAPEMMPGEVLLRAEAADAAGNLQTVIRTVNIVLRERWFTSLDDSTFGPVLVDEGAIAVATADRLTIVEANGTERCHIVGANEGAPLTYIPETQSVAWATLTEFRIVSAVDCTQLHQEASTGGGITATAYRGGRIYGTAFEGELHSWLPDGTDKRSINLATALETPRAMEIGRGLDVAPDGTVYVSASFTTASGVLFIVDDITAETPSIQVVPMPPSLREGILATSEGVYLGGNDGRLYKVDPEGARAWRVEPELSPGAPIECRPAIVDDETVAVCDGDGRVVTVRRDTGAVEWTYDATEGRDGVSGSLLIGTGGVTVAPGGRFLAIGDRLGMMHVIERRDSALVLRWRARVSSSTIAPIAGRPALSDRYAYMVSTGGLVVGFNL